MAGWSAVKDTVAVRPAVETLRIDATGCPGLTIVHEWHTGWTSAVAATHRVCAPAARPRYTRGDEHGANGPPSSEHSKRLKNSADHENDAVCTVEMAGGVAVNAARPGRSPATRGGYSRRTIVPMPTPTPVYVAANPKE